MSDWRVLSDQRGIDELLKLFGNFHDGCIREMHLWTETFVKENLSMSCPSHLDTKVRILFQRQFVSPSAVELQFDGVVQVRMQPTAENYDSVIFEAGIFMSGDLFYWTDGGATSLNEFLLGSPGTLIVGKQLKWRDASPWMGPTLRYRSEVGADNFDAT